MTNPEFNTILAKALSDARQREYEEEQAKYLNGLTLGSIEGLSDDAKLLIYLNPKIVNDLAAAILNNNRLMALVNNKRLTAEEASE